MGSKRKRSSVGGETETETETERKDRKRLKKESKKEKRKSASSASNLPATSPEQATSTDDNSKVFLRKKLELTVSLLPGSLGDPQKSVEDSLRTFLLKFSDGVGGILLAFNNVKIDGKGMILNELPYIHFDVSCDALVFCPTAGCQLTGVVTESFHSHLSLVVHHYFNANVSAEHMRAAGYDFDAEQELWFSQETSLSLSKGDQVQFVVDKVHESGGIISLNGSVPSLILQ
jgi:DNA-directed RNA polymerase subunit E'/Rpb7